MEMGVLMKIIVIEDNSRECIRELSSGEGVKKRLELKTGSRSRMFDCK